MKKILLVDDSTAIRNILLTALMDDYEIVEAEDGEIALQKCKEQDINFFILDVNMPVMDGITLVKHLRSMDKYKKTPIIMLTTESKGELKNKAKEFGANGWVLKPCDPEKLLGVIKKLI